MNTIVYVGMDVHKESRDHAIDCKILASIMMATMYMNCVNPNRKGATRIVRTKLSTHTAKRIAG